MSSEKFEDSEEEFRSIYEALVNTLKNRLPKLYGGRDFVFKDLHFFANCCLVTK